MRCHRGLGGRSHARILALRFAGRRASGWARSPCGGWRGCAPSSMFPHTRCPRCTFVRMPLETLTRSPAARSRAAPINSASSGVRSQTTPRFRSFSLPESGAFRIQGGVIPRPRVELARLAEPEARKRKGPPDISVQRAFLCYFMKPSARYSETASVREGGLEPPRPIRALAPQASASAISAIRAHFSGTFFRTTEVRD
ncbi:MAG: hypothetical protein JWP30_2096 [Homoserinimonas sp.]|jgi:hypothetical protein|nr:hypothetical protein [Homoserinimonas sp.]